MAAREDIDARLSYIKVLVDIGWLDDAELELADLLDEVPESLTALSLYAKVKHIRGELSQAIACWARLHTHAPHNPTAQMQLGAIMQMALNPERAAGEFLALGHNHLARKPAGQLALEEAFELFHERKVTDARARCAQLAARYRGKDNALYLLAVLADAWMAELSGDLTVAAAVLEKLGTERGFETDLDRLFALVRVYARIGSRERLAAAAKICVHLERQFEERGIEMISLLSELHRLYERLGDDELASLYAAKFRDGVSRRMHRPTRADLVYAGCYRYLPLVRLWAVREVGEDDLEVTTARERALAAALDDHRFVAFAELEGSEEVIDIKYLADLADLDGDEERALELRLRAHDADPDDLLIAGCLLQHYDEHGDPRIAEHFADAGSRERVARRIETELEHSPLRPDLWRYLAALHAIRGDEDQAQRCRERAEVLRQTRDAREAVIGRALAAGVYHFVGKAKGLIHEVWAHREVSLPGKGGALPDANILGNLTPEMKHGVRNNFLAVREYVRVKFPQRTADLFDYDYVYKVPKEDEPSGGLSAGLPTALAFLSVFLQRPLPQHTASSGVLVADAHDVVNVGPVAEADYKVKGAYHRNLRALLLPRSNRALLEQSAIVPWDIVDEIVRYVGNLDEAVKAVFGRDIFVFV